MSGPSRETSLLKTLKFGFLPLVLLRKLKPCTTGLRVSLISSPSLLPSHLPRPPSQRSSKIPSIWGFGICYPSDGALSLSCPHHPHGVLPQLSPPILRASGKAPEPPARDGPQPWDCLFISQSQPLTNSLPPPLDTSPQGQSAHLLVLLLPGSGERLQDYLWKEKWMKDGCHVSLEPQHLSSSFLLGKGFHTFPPILEGSESIFPCFCQPQGGINTPRGQAAVKARPPSSKQSRPCPASLPAAQPATTTRKTKPK